MAGETSVDGKGHMDRVRAGARTRHERILEGDCQLCNAQSDENASRTASETENALAVILWLSFTFGHLVGNYFCVILPSRADPVLARLLVHIPPFMSRPLEVGTYRSTGHFRTSSGRGALQCENIRPRVTLSIDVGVGMCRATGGYNEEH